MNDGGGSLLSTLSVSNSTGWPLISFYVPTEATGNDNALRFRPESTHADSSEPEL